MSAPLTGKGQWKTVFIQDSRTFQPPIKIGNSELTPELLDELAEVAGFIKFLREYDPNWEKLYAAYKVTKRLEGT